MNKALYSRRSDEWSTPQDLFDILKREFRFTLDPCATVENAKCTRFYTKDENGLKKSWVNESVFVNPPYSQISKWMEKAYNEAVAGAMVVCLIPSRTDTRYFHRYVRNASEVRFLKGRLRFGGSKNSAPFPSAVVVFIPKIVKLQQPYVMFWDWRVES